MHKNYKHVYTASYTTEKKLSKELAEIVLSEARKMTPSESNRHIVLEKHYSDSRGNSVMEVYKEDLSADEQMLYNQFYSLAKSCDFKNVLDMLDGAAKHLCYYYDDCYFSDREIQEMFLVLRASVNEG